MLPTTTWYPVTYSLYLTPQETRLLEGRDNKASFHREHDIQYKIWWRKYEVGTTDSTGLESQPTE